MDRVYTKASEGSSSSDADVVLSDAELYTADNEEMFSEMDERPASPSPEASPVPAQTHLSFFNQQHHQQMQHTFEPAVLLLWTALLEELRAQNVELRAQNVELRTQNVIALTKLNREDEQKLIELEAAQKRDEAAKKLEEADQKHFEEDLKPLLYL